MQFDWWTFGFQVINLLVLIWLLGHFFFQPVARIISERRTETAKVLADAELAQSRAAQAETAARAEQEKNKAERLSIIEAARLEAEAQQTEILKKARLDAAKIATDAQHLAERKHQDNRRERVKDAATLAVRITRRLLGNLPADARVAGYRERLQAALTDLQPEQRDELAADVGNLRLVSPRKLNKSELSLARKAVKSALDGDRTANIDVDVNDALIAGLELRGQHVVIHNSLGYDLSRIAEAMATDEKS